MTKRHPIMPPDELLDKWNNLPLSTQEIFVIVAQWGADQELVACCEWMANVPDFYTGSEIDLRAARRPKPLSLKQQALEELENMVKAAKDFGFSGTDPTAIRQVLEALPE
jgi:hypothetical protein